MALGRYEVDGKTVTGSVLTHNPRADCSQTDKDGLERTGATRSTRAGGYFGGDAASWLAPQADYDLKTLATRGDIARKVTPRDGALGLLQGDRDDCKESPQKCCATTGSGI